MIRISVAKWSSLQARIVFIRSEISDDRHGYRKIEAFNHACDSRRAKNSGSQWTKIWPKSIFCTKSLHFLCSRIIELTFNAVLTAASLLLHATPLYTQWASLCRGHFPPGQHFHRTFPLSHKTREFLQTHFIFMVALWNRADHYIFIVSFVLLLSSFFSFLA